MYLHFNYKGNAKLDETAKAASQFIPDLLQLKCSGYVQNKQKIQERIDRRTEKLLTPEEPYSKFKKHQMICDPTPD